MQTLKHLTKAMKHKLDAANLYVLGLQVSNFLTILKCFEKWRCNIFSPFLKHGEKNNC